MNKNIASTICSYTNGYLSQLRYELYGVFEKNSAPITYASNFIMYKLSQEIDASLAHSIGEYTKKLVVENNSRGCKKSRDRFV